MLRIQLSGELQYSCNCARRIAFCDIVVVLGPEFGIQCLGDGLARGIDVIDPEHTKCMRPVRATAACKTKEIPTERYYEFYYRPVSISSVVMYIQH
jgi:hypothetical protein